MGLDSSFVVVTSAQRVDDLLGAVSACLEADDATRLRAALPWSPAIDRVLLSRRGAPVRERRGIAKLVKTSAEVGLDLCFTFRIAPDHDLLRLRWPRAWLRPLNPSYVPIGCIWCSLAAGEELAVLRATAATSGMSRVLGRSPGARALWQGAAALSGALAVFWDFEDEERWQLLFPHVEAVPKPDEVPCLLDDDVHVDVDAYFGRALEEAGVLDAGTERPAG